MEPSVPVGLYNLAYKPTLSIYVCGGGGDLGGREHGDTGTRDWGVEPTLSMCVCVVVVVWVVVAWDVVEEVVRGVRESTGGRVQVG